VAESAARVVNMHGNKLKKQCNFCKDNIFDVRNIPPPPPPHTHTHTQRPQVYGHTQLAPMEVCEQNFSTVTPIYRHPQYTPQTSVNKQRRYIRV